MQSPDQTPHSGPLALLGARRFGPLFATQFLSAFNDNTLKNALVLMLAYRPEMSGGMSAGILIPLAGGLFILPFFLCSATAGELADALDKAWLIRLLKLTEIAVMAIAAAAVLRESTGLMLALLFVMGVEAAFFGPLKYAILPDLLGRRDLLLGNALVEAGTFLAILLGTIAGMLIAGAHGARLVAGLILAVALGAWVSSRAIPGTEPAEAGARISWNFVAATARLIADARRERVRFRSILGISWFWLVGATYLSQFPTYVRAYLGSEEAVVTLFLTVFSVGVGCGSLLCNRILRGRISAGIVPWGALGLALFSIDLWAASPATVAAGPEQLLTVATFIATPSHWRILADLLGISASGGVFILPLYALLQTAGDARHRARAIGANNVVNAAAMVLSALAVIALVASGVSVPGLFLLTGVATLAVAGAFWRLRAVLVPSEGENDMTTGDLLNVFRLDGKVAVVTGGGRGIGRASAETFAAAGAAVAILDRDEDVAEATARAIGNSASFHAADVGDEAAVEAAMAAIAERHGGIDVLVAGAGIGLRHAAVDHPLADWDKVVAVNLTGVFLCARAAARYMFKRGGGAVVNIASIMGFSGGGVYPNVSYQATKGAVVNMTRALAVEWAKDGIRVNAVAPTWVRTDLTAALVDRPEVMEKIAAMTPMGRLATAQEIANAILYLASPAASAVTGHTLAVDCGFLAQ